jgi:hypothetical protein
VARRVITTQAMVALRLLVPWFLLVVVMVVVVHQREL